MKDGKYGVLVHGAGWVSGQHVAAFTRNPHTEVVAISSRKRTSAQARADEAGLTGIGIYDDFQRALQHEGVDIVSICTPQHVHCENVLAAAAAGKTPRDRKAGRQLARRVAADAGRGAPGTGQNHRELRAALEPALQDDQVHDRRRRPRQGLLRRDRLRAQRGRLVERVRGHPEGVDRRQRLPGRRLSRHRRPALVRRSRRVRGRPAGRGVCVFGRLAQGRSPGIQLFQERVRRGPAPGVRRAGSRAGQVRQRRTRQGLGQLRLRHALHVPDRDLRRQGDRPRQQGVVTQISRHRTVGCKSRPCCRIPRKCRTIPSRDRWTTSSSVFWRTGNRTATWRMRS